MSVDQADRRRRRRHPFSNQAHLLEVGFGGVARQGHVLHLPPPQLTVGQGQPAAQGGRGAEEEAVLAQQVLLREPAQVPAGVLWVWVWVGGWMEGGMNGSCMDSIECHHRSIKSDVDPSHRRHQRTSGIGRPSSGKNPFGTSLGSRGARRLSCTPPPRSIISPSCSEEEESGGGLEEAVKCRPSAKSRRLGPPAAAAARARSILESAAAADDGPPSLGDDGALLPESSSPSAPSFLISARAAAAAVAAR